MSFRIQYKLYLENTDGPHLAGQLWPPGCMSVSAAPEQMCLPKSMGNYTMYAGTRIPPAEPHRLACGFSQIFQLLLTQRCQQKNILKTVCEKRMLLDMLRCNCREIRIRWFFLREEPVSDRFFFYAKYAEFWNQVPKMIYEKIKSSCFYTIFFRILFWIKFHTLYESIMRRCLSLW